MIAWLRLWYPCDVWFLICHDAKKTGPTVQCLFVSVDQFYQFCLLLQPEMISVHTWNKPPHLNCISALPDRSCAVISAFLLHFDNKVQNTWAIQSHRTSRVRSLWLSSHDVLEMSAIHMNTCWKSFSPLVNSHVKNVLAKIASDLNQPLFQFISVLDVCSWMVIHIW